MSARISYMYRVSGGCDKEHICEKCGYYITDKKGAVYGKCRLHESMTEEERMWDGRWMSCKHHQAKAASKRRSSAKAATTSVFKAESSGQLRFI